MLGRSILICWLLDGPARPKPDLHTKKTNTAEGVDIQVLNASSFPFSVGIFHDKKMGKQR